MPKRKKRNNKNRHQGKGKKGQNQNKRRRTAYWCQRQQKLHANAAATENTTAASAPLDFDVTLMISRVDLFDNYRIAPKTASEEEAQTQDDNKQPRDGKGVATPSSPVKANDNVFTTTETNDHDVEPEDKATNKKQKLEVEERSHDLGKISPAKGEARSQSEGVQDEKEDQGEQAATTVADTMASPQIGSSKQQNGNHDASEEEAKMPAKVHVTCHASCFDPSCTPWGKDVSPFAPQQTEVADLPNGDCGDGIVNPHPKTEVPDKYWAQRRRLFTKFDEGIVLDSEGWFSVTPEEIANHIALRMVVGHDKQKQEGGLIILDAFAGMGGNSIALARRPEVELVICVDSDRNRLLLAAANAKVYGIAPSKMCFVHSDACFVMTSYADGALVRERKAMANERSSTAAESSTASGFRLGGIELLPDALDGIFLSPPWGGQDYEKIGPCHYDLSCITVKRSTDITTSDDSENQSVDGQELLRLAIEALPADAGRSRFSYFLPRNTNGLLVAQSAHSLCCLDKLELEQQYLCSKLKTVTVYAQKCLQE